MPNEQKKMSDRWWFWLLLLLLLWWFFKKRKKDLANTPQTEQPLQTPIEVPEPAPTADIWTPTIIPDIPPVTEESPNLSYLTGQGYAPTNYTNEAIGTFSDEIITYLNGWNYFYPSNGKYVDSGMPLYTQWRNLDSISADTTAAREQITRYMKGWNLSHSI